MMFLNPIGWYFLALAPVLVLLYLRRIRRRSVPVSTLLFWRDALGKTMHRAWFGSLRRWASLLLQLVVLALIILALLRPEPKSPGGIAPVALSTVLVLDGRARMTAVEPGGVSRFEKALRAAREIVAAAREGASVALLLARPGPETISPFCSDPVVLTSRLSGLGPTDAGGTLEPALALARELAATRPGRTRILLITDGAENAGPGIEAVAVGTALDNVAIVRFAARPRIASPETADLLLEVANFGRAPVHGNVEISADGTLLDVKPFDLAPGERKTNVFPSVPRAGSGRLMARLDANDALPLDNAAYALLPAPEPCRVLLVTKGNRFLEKLLAADATVRFELLAPDAFQLVKDFATIHGNALFLKSSPVVSTGTLDRPPVSDADADSPLFRFVQWRTVAFLRADKIELPVCDGWRFDAPLRSVDRPLVVTGVHPGPAGSGSEQRVAVFAFDVADSNLPLQVAFPLLISNTVHWLAQTEPESSEPVECGKAVALAADETAPAEPDSGVEPGSTAARPGRVVKGALEPLRNGFYRIDRSGGPGESHRWLAVNTGNEAESNLLAAPAAASGSQVAPWTGPAAGSLWRWAALAAFALLAGEWWLFHRRRTE